MRKRGFIYRVFDLYYDGFRSMTLGKTLWLVILIKLFYYVFFVLKICSFFPNFYKKSILRGGDDAKFVEKGMLKRN